MKKQLKIARSPAWVEALVFDRAVLRHQTMDDVKLADEILGLFTAQLARLEKADWAALDLAFEMHTLRGAAAAVGALQLESLAADWRAEGAGLAASVKAAIRSFRKAAKAA